MKRKIIAAIFILLSLLGLCACNNDGTQIEANENTFLIDFHIDCDEDVYGIHFEYYLDGVPVGGGLTGNANGSKITARDVLAKDFIPDDFPESADLSRFQLEILVVDKNGEEYPCDSILNIVVAYGSTYDLSITGSYEDGFSAKQLS